ncbi:MAG: 6-bladed beta-propeller [Salinibacter sp.]
MSEGESFYFDGIPDVAVADDGRMYVLDWNARHIKVLAPNGSLLRTIGREGRGPGEFQAPRFAVVSRTDSLYVLDSRNGRISVFTTSGTFVRSVQVKHHLFDAFLVPDGQKGFAIAYEDHRPGAEEDGKYVLPHLDASGNVTDTLLTAAARDIHPVKPAVSLPVPFGRGPHVAMGPEDRVHVGWNDSLRVVSYEVDGTRLRTRAVSRPRLLESITLLHASPRSDSRTSLRCRLRRRWGRLGVRVDGRKGGHSLLSATLQAPGTCSLFHPFGLRFRSTFCSQSTLPHDPIADPPSFPGFPARRAAPCPSRPGSGPAHSRPLRD